MAATGSKGEKAEVPRWWRSEKSWLRDEQKGPKAKKGKEDSDVEEIDIDEEEDEGGDWDGEEDEEMEEDEEEEGGVRVSFDLPIRSKGFVTR